MNVTVIVIDIYDSTFMLSLYSYDKLFKIFVKRKKKKRKKISHILKYSQLRKNDQNLQ